MGRHVEERVSAPLSYNQFRFGGTQGHAGVDNLNAS